MFEIECPHCEVVNQIDGEDLPDRACDDGEHECDYCGMTFKFGWYAELELR